MNPWLASVVMRTWVGPDKLQPRPRQIKSWDRALTFLSTLRNILLQGDNLCLEGDISVRQKIWYSFL